MYTVQVSGAQARVIDTLRATRKLIENPAAWCKKSMAKTFWGAECGCDDPNATAFCLSGAIGKAALDGGILSPVFQELKNQMSRWGFTPSVAAYNDDPKTNHLGVLYLIDATIYGVATGQGVTR